uniref:Uncharacterized protein n=1 Tax=Clytia hemisphaerica TaxID=252671 RepID=A0A7M5WSR1_9CNID
MGRLKCTCIALAILALAMCTYVLAVNTISNETQSFDQRTFNETCEMFILPRTNGEEKVEYCGIRQYWKSKISYGGRLLISCIPGLLAVVILIKPLDSDTTTPISLITILCILLVAWEAWAVGCDIAIFILMEIGYAVDSRITRQPYVQLFLLGLAILRSMKLIIMLGAPKDLAKKRRQLIEGSPKDLAKENPERSWSHEDLFVLITVVIQLPLMILQHFYIGKYIHIHGRYFARACAETIFSFLFIIYLLAVYNRKSKTNKISFFINLATWISILAIFIIHLIISSGIDGMASDPSCLYVQQGMLIQTPFAQPCLTTFETLLLGVAAITIMLYLSAKIMIAVVSSVMTNIKYGRFENNNSALIQDEIWTSKQWEKLQQF